MKIVLSLVWLALAVGFAHLGRGLDERSGPELPAFEPESPRFEIQGQGFHIELDVEGTPLNEPFEELEAEVERYVEEMRESTRRSQTRLQRASWAGIAAALAGLALTWAPRGRSPEV